MFLANDNVVICPLDQSQFSKKTLYIIIIFNKYICLSLCIVSSAAYRCLYFFAGTPEERGGGEGSEFWEGSNNRSANSRKQKHEAHTFYEGSRNCARARGRGKKAKIE